MDGEAAGCCSNTICVCFDCGGKRFRRLFERGEELFRRHGDLTIFLARFVFGMRIIAGPLAGILRMPWSKFVLFNFLGALTWVTAIAVAGYQFGEHWEELIKTIGQVNLGITVVAAYAAFWIWRRYRAKRRNVKEVEKRAEKESGVGPR